MVNLIRKSSDTPNIQNYDDIRGFKFASCGENGVIKDYLNACGYQINGQDFFIKSGEVILDGWQVGINTSGWTGTINNLSGTVYYTVYLEVDTSVIGNETAAIKMTYDTVSFPTLDKGQNLSLTQMGIARLALYHFQAVDNVIQNVERVFKLLDGEAYIAKYASSDYSKGTIEERLANLGFKQGTLTLKDAWLNTMSVPDDLFKRQGNYVIMNGYIIGSASIQTNSTTLLGTVPELFRPKEDIHVCCYGASTQTDPTPAQMQLPADVVIKKDGTVTLTGFQGIFALSIVNGMFNGTGNTIESFKSGVVFINQGWEVEPIS